MQVGRLQELYKNWEEDPAVCFVALKVFFTPAQKKYLRNRKTIGTKIYLLPQSYISTNTVVVVLCFFPYKSSYMVWILKGGGRAFSAGGDIVALYNLLQKGTVFIFLLPSFPPPHLYLMIFYKHTTSQKRLPRVYACIKIIMGLCRISRSKHIVVLM